VRLRRPVSARGSAVSSLPAGAATARFQCPAALGGSVIFQATIFHFTKWFAMRDAALSHVKSNSVVTSSIRPWTPFATILVIQKPCIITEDSGAISRGERTACYERKSWPDRSRTDRTGASRGCWSDATIAIGNFFQKCFALGRAPPQEGRNSHVTRTNSHI
jgi:hypothetical protein